MDNKDYRDAVKFMLFVPLIIGLIFGISALVMWLWNAILPDLIGVNEVGYWQAMGLLLLSKILFGGLGSGNKFKSEKSSKKKYSMCRGVGDVGGEDQSNFFDEDKKESDRCK
ncbi:MAG: hypothetical protein BM557_10890 [Flavobacterium sp. MedPE-SWcel]|uniref:hypothetical protein n=1 Tax=uncultured Flavobacterium sp. TaxID=165435 RepID=UPI00091ED4A5|nr:hypothetical protein [uncultured Flavobacterium sp.]OIQ15799.1 MAG: hypothetical protein BM557_10890 [Flavobacterium sp. MedPE-SWcel]